jgi:hypothetical protein
MKHKVTCVREQLWEMYSSFDSFSLNKMFFEDISRLNQTYFDNFYDMNRVSVEAKSKLTEKKLINAFKMDTEFSSLRRKTTTELENDIDELKIPMKARALIGSERTNADYKEESSEDFSICKSSESAPSLHFTIEWTDVNTGIRFARTLFLSTLADDDYMKDVHFSLEDRSTNA